MSLANTVSLGALRLQARQRADLQNNTVVTNAEFNQYISQSYKRLYDMLVAAYGNEYYMAPLYQFTLSSSQYYPLPDGTTSSIGTTSLAPACYKLLNVDLQYSGSPTGYVTVMRFEEIERNKYAYPNSAVNLLGRTNLKYRISGNNIEFIPIPMAGQVIQLKYVPQPTPLIFLPTVQMTSSSSSLAITDTSDLVTGMSIYGTGVPDGATVGTVTATSVVMSSVATVTAPQQTLYFWNDSTVINGISGWEEYIVIDAAIKARSKQEEDVTELRNQKAEMIKAIEGMAEGRDIGQACHVSDVIGANGYGGIGGWGGLGENGGW